MSKEYFAINTKTLHLLFLFDFVELFQLPVLKVLSCPLKVSHQTSSSMPVVHAPGRIACSFMVNNLILNLITQNNNPEPDDHYVFLP